MIAAARVIESAAILLLITAIYAKPLNAATQYVMPGVQSLSQGREIWLKNCETCHGYGVADAPIPMNPDEWGSRLNQGKQVLYEHAINGFIGPDYSMMPARGGNDDLNDEEVKLAVDYMVFLASYYINKLDMTDR
jgi:cytochrome c5